MTLYSLFTERELELLNALRVGLIETAGVEVVPVETEEQTDEPE